MPGVLNSFGAPIRRWRKLGTYLLAAAAVSACATGSLYYTAEPFSAQVLDAETGEPIAGAVVVANWELVQGSLDGERHVAQLEVKETVTDAMGRFRIEGFTKANFTLGELRHADPRVIVFKGGYKAGVYYSPIVDPGNLPGPRRKAAVDGKLLRLKKLKPAKGGGDLLMYHVGLDGDIDDIIRDCEWKKIPKLLLAMDEEYLRLRAQDPGAWIEIGLEKLAMNSRSDCKLDADFIRGQR